MQNKNAGLTQEQDQEKGWLARMHAAERRLEAQDGVSAGWQLVILPVLLLLIYLRLPSLFTNAQFYGEDGSTWYANAYNLGWLRSLTIPVGGYLNTLQRVGAGLALLVPLRWAPLTMMLCGAVVQVLPVPVLLSARCRGWATLRVRILFALIFVLLPNAREVQVVMTNSQWHLALVALLLGFACAPRSWAGRAVDTAVFVMLGFSGPFGVILLPLLVLFWWVRRQRWTLAVIALMGVGTVVQFILIVLHHGDRVQDALGATPARLVRLLGGNIFGCGLLGAHEAILKAPLPALAALLCLGLVVYGLTLRYGRLELKCFVIFSVVLLVPELRTPLIAGPHTLWEALLRDESGRYWFFPMLAFLWGAAWCALDAPRAYIRFGCAAVLVTLTFGMVADWRYDPYSNEHWPESVRRFEQAPAGTHVVMQIVPRPVTMDLLKH